ncbi:hypothetical protein ACFQ4H_25965 [Micromonospora sonneratiae]|uniref:WXG100 family type VII secretion target n=1 Tax=Micromonospora sonneratiae TaxID=1184706 RepID=A0ABW3YL89_9ACTN
MINIDVEALEKVAALLQDPARTLSSAVLRFNANSARLGKPWGDDEIGKQWSAVYEPGLASVQDGFTKTEKGIIKLSDQFRKAAKQYKKTEEANLT